MLQNKDDTHYYGDEKKFFLAKREIQMRRRDANEINEVFICFHFFFRFHTMDNGYGYGYISITIKCKRQKKHMEKKNTRSLSLYE